MQFLLEKQLMDSLNKNSWSFLENVNSSEVTEYEALFQSQETQQLKQSIKEAKESYSQSQNPKKNWILYVAAAAVITLFSILIFDQSEKSNDELFASYLQKSDLMALVDRNGNDSIFALAQMSFNNKKYDQVVELLSPILDSTKNSNVYLYLAISDIELGAFSQAEKILNKLITSDLLDSEKGYWYKSLLYLKSDQLKKSKRELQRIIDSSYYLNKEAKKLIKKLK
jgi:tetratricopeptide (TPR) repeat protein